MSPYPSLCWVGSRADNLFDSEANALVETEALSRLLLRAEAIAAIGYLAHHGVSVGYSSKSSGQSLGPTTVSPASGVGSAAELVAAGVRGSIAK
ncbi:hypothetical protein [Nocardia nova]|uniref:hypothetical protein n=1 Tax=Nocardia nova TaxID=37330 RepID=UPI0015E44C3C|nr:hypothetical protein [Nocardia nova]